MSSTDNESSANKVSRKARRRAKEREANHAVTVLCNGSGEMHLADGVTIKQLQKRFPDMVIHPNATYTLDVSDICVDCKKVAKEREERREAAAAKKKIFEDRKAEQRNEAIDRRLETIRRLYRSDEEQKTRLTLHDVYYVKQTNQGPIVCRGSFNGFVSHVHTAKTETGYEVCITVKLNPKKGLQFKDLSPINANSGLSLSKNRKGECTVKLNAQHIDKDSAVVRLGGRCNPKKCEGPAESCPDHAFRETVELGAPVMVKK